MSAVKRYANFSLKFKNRTSESESWWYIFASMREYNALDEHNGWHIHPVRGRREKKRDVYILYTFNVCIMYCIHRTNTYIVQCMYEFHDGMRCELVVIDIWCNGGDICQNRRQRTHTQHMYSINSLASSMSSIKFNARISERRASEKKSEICKIHQKPIYLDDIYSNGSIVNSKRLSFAQYFPFSN